MAEIERTYLVASEQIARGRWLSDSLGSSRNVERIHICYFNPETTAQMDGEIVFVRITQQMVAPQLRLFEDSWAALQELGMPFLKELGKLDEKTLGRLPSPADITAALDRLGFTKETPT